MVAYRNVPVELKNLKQWVLWKLVDRGGKPTKVPFQPNGQPASSSNPETWSSFADVVAQVSKYSGVGFVFSKDDPFIGIDLDGCRDPKTGRLDGWAKAVVLDCGSYTEVSPSGTGVKIFAKSNIRWGHKNKVELNMPAIYGKTPGVEIYQEGRYFAVTGKNLQNLIEIQHVEDWFDAIADKFEMRHPVVLPSGVGVKFESPVIDRARAYIEPAEGAVSGQSGHSKTFYIACCLVKGFGLDESEAMQLMHEYNQKCQPPWSERELLHKVRSAAKQPGVVGALRDSRPDDWQKIRMPSNWKEHIVLPEEEQKTEVRRTTLHDATSLYLADMISGKNDLVETGLPDLDAAIGGGLAMGEMVIVAARPSHGKSMVALQMAHHFSLNQMPVVMISEEMSVHALGKRALQFSVAVPEEHWKNHITVVTNEAARHFKSRAKIEIVEYCGSVEKAVEEIERAVQQDSAKIALVDYAQILGAKGRDERERIGKVSKALKDVAKRLNIIVVVLCQLNREIEKRKVFVPAMSDIKETGQLEQDADVVIFGVWPCMIDKQQDRRKYQLFVGKNRNRAIGCNGMVECMIEPHRQRLIDDESRPAVRFVENEYSNDFQKWTG